MNKNMHLLLRVGIFILTVVADSNSNHETFTNLVSSSLIETGRTQYQSLISKIEVPQFGFCWKKSVMALHNGCNQLSEFRQSQLALAFTDCFLQMSGEKPNNCQSETDITKRELCLKGMSDRAYHVYVEFYTHTQNMCFFLRSSIWQESAEDTISRLTTSSKEISNQLEDVKGSNEAVLKTQQESLTIQHDLVKSSLTLSQILQESRMSVAALMNELRESTARQAGALGDLSRRLSELQAWAIGEVSWIESMVYYIISISIAYMLTCFPRSNESRFWILVILSGGLGLEQFLHHLMIKGHLNENYALTYFQDDMYYWIWRLRTVIIITCTSIYLYFIYNYTNYDRVNHELLTKIHEKLNHLTQNVHSDSMKYQVENASRNGNAPVAITDKEEPGNSLNTTLNAHIERLNESIDYIESTPGIVQVGGGMSQSYIDAMLNATPNVHQKPRTRHVDMKLVRSEQKRNSSAIVTIETKIPFPAYNLRTRSSTPRPQK